MNKKLESIFKILGYIPGVIRLTDQLQFQKLFALFALCFVMLVGFTMWSERTQVMDYVISKISTSTPTWEVSQQTKDIIISETNKNSSISWVAINELDLGANAKRLKYWYNDNPDVYNKLNTKFDTNTSAIFDFEQRHTDQMVGVLQNQFICVPFPDTNLKQSVPELGEQTQIVCRIAIPPFYGRFVGVLTIGIRGEYSETTMFQAKTMATSIATNIYWHDVIKLPNKK